jgi:hypothetical protein
LLYRALYEREITVSPDALASIAAIAYQVALQNIRAEVEARGKQMEAQALKEAAGRIRTEQAKLRHVGRQLDILTSPKGTFDIDRLISITDWIFDNVPANDPGDEAAK